MISIVAPSVNRQDHLDAVLPGWLNQKDVDYEVVLGIDAGTKVPAHPRLRTIPISLPFSNMAASNAVIDAAKGDLLVIACADVIVFNPMQLKIMLDQYKPGTSVSTRTWFTDGRNDPGLMLSWRLVAKEDMIKAGCWHLGYDGGWGYEDDDVMSCLMENGIKLVISNHPDDFGVLHIPHPRPNVGDPKWNERYLKSQAVYNSRHKKSWMQLYKEQQ